MQTEIKKAINHIIITNYDYISSNWGEVDNSRAGHCNIRTQPVWTAGSLEGRMLVFLFTEGVQYLLWNIPASMALMLRLAERWGHASGRRKRKACTQWGRDLNSALPYSKWMFPLGFFFFFSFLNVFIYLKLLCWMSEECRVSDSEAFSFFAACLPPSFKYAYP